MRFAVFQAHAPDADDRRVSQTLAKAI